MTLSVEDFTAIDYAVSLVRDQLSPEDRFDLRQELAISLLKRRPEGEIRAWLTVCARNWTRIWLRDEANDRRLRSEMAQGFPVPGCRRGDAWGPSWYPPHRDAKEFAPFAVPGARMMLCKGDRFGKSGG